MPALQMSNKTYRFAECLGGGAVGRVWRAVDEHGRSYAIKFFTADNPWHREAQALAHASALMRVHHPGVVEIVAIERIPDPDTQEPELAIVMEHLQGIDLARFKGPLTLERAQDCIVKLSGGLQAIHDAGLTHSDLHIGNVFITSNSAKLLDIPYEKTLANAGTATRLRTRTDDVRDFIRVVRKVLEHVPGLDKKALLDSHYRAEQRATTPAEVLTTFAGVWNSVAGPDWLRRLIGETRSLYLLAQRTTRHAYDCTTYVIANDRVVGTVPNLLIAFNGELLALQDPGREILILRQSLLESWQESADEPQPWDYEKKQLPAPLLKDMARTTLVELAHPEPESGSKVGLFTFERGVYLKGFLGPFLFVEQLDYKYGGGAHPDSTRIGYVVDLRTGLQRTSILQEEEQAEIHAREGQVARESFIRLRETEPLLQEVEVSLAAAYPTFEVDDADAKLRLVFTTFAAFVESEHRWASYTQVEELQARKLPQELLPFAAVPPEVTKAMRDVPGVMIGWSALGSVDRGVADLSALLIDERDAKVRRTPEVTVTNLPPEEATLLSQHNEAAPWRSPYHGKADLNIALEVALEVARISPTRESATRRFAPQLATELRAADREVTPDGGRTLESAGLAAIGEYFDRLPPREP